MLDRFLGKWQESTKVIAITGEFHKILIMEINRLILVIVFRFSKFLGCVMMSFFINLLSLTNICG